MIESQQAWLESLIYQSKVLSHEEVLPLPFLGRFVLTEVANPTWWGYCFGESSRRLDI
jgi:hypothetical protein